VATSVVGSQMLVSIVNMGYVDSDAVLIGTLPETASNVRSTLCGSGSWIVDRDV